MEVAEVSDINYKSRYPISHYPSKRDLWLVILLLSLALFFVYVPVILFSEPIHPLVKVFGSIFFLAMSVVFPWILFGTSYRLTDEHLVIRCLSRDSSISFRDIYEVFPTRNPLSAPACSLDRLCIKFKGSKLGALISPRDKTAFIQDLLLRCPQLIRDNERLILRSGI